MRRLTASIVFIALAASMSGLPASASEESPLVPGTTVSPADQDASFVMGPPLEQSIAGWREIGRTPVRIGADREVWFGQGKLAVAGDRLVMVGQTCPVAHGRCTVATWHSDDAITWTRSSVPGTDPSVADVASTPDGIIAIGTEGRGRQRAAAMWASSDGIEWTSVPAPPARKAGRIVAVGDTTVVQADEALWSSKAGVKWQRLGKPPAGRAVAGPGGFLSWQGGGQDLVVPTAIWHSPDGVAWKRQRLPKALRGGHPAFGEIQIESIGDLWVLIPKEKAPGSIFTSKDGRRWEQDPRPVGMHGGYVWWIERIGDGIQASGTLYEPRMALWSWDLGEQSGEAEPYTGHGQYFVAPVRMGDGYVAIGSDGRCDAEALTVWRWEPPSPSSGTAAASERTGAPAPPACWSSRNESHAGRYDHTSTSLTDGRVLIVGGVGGTGSSDLDTTEVFDPGLQSFGLTGYLVEGRDLATATRLADGRVLVAGGMTADGLVQTAELYDPTTGLFTLTGSRTKAGAPDDAVLLDDGRVLVVDGREAEIYDPDRGTFTSIAMMGEVRDDGRLARLPDGRMLVVGSARDSRDQAAAEVFDPVSMTFEPRSLERSLRGGHTITALQDGRVLVAGGKGDPAAAHLYDPATGTFESVGPLDRVRHGHSAVLAPDGRVLLVGGLGERGTSRTIEAYDPATGAFNAVGVTKRPRIRAAATLIDDGRVLISGGKHENGNVERTAELFDPKSAKSGFIKPDLP